MALTLTDHYSLLKGFPDSGYHMAKAPTSVANPIFIEWQLNGQPHRFRLWAFDITHGGGGAAVRAADEFRIQITNGPAALTDFDSGGWIDLLIGYSRDR